ncbi:hypothetical protein HK103_001668 [Boothiomyces macroporosus]|uniref:Uncharacterized protein n=1 Tax=Boothiomyces macroporosus TaxID=261099 RepID=A0AAD5Y0F8_9FUNG|nr:hypothetical protein HK103_001668 [Boothiomyces macroporosus]
MENNISIPKEYNYDALTLHGNTYHISSTGIHPGSKKHQNIIKELIVESRNSTDYDVTKLYQDLDRAKKEIQEESSDEESEEENVEYFDLKRKWNAGPQIKQYEYNNRIYQSTMKAKVLWFELFVDLIYAGAMRKVGTLLDFDLISFGMYVLVIIPFIFHWEEFVHLNNWVYQKGVLRKVFNALVLGVVILMTVCVKYAFDPDPDVNTSGIFLGCHIISILMIELYILYAMCNSVPYRTTEMLYSPIIRGIQAVFYLSVNVFKPGYDGGITNQIIIWACGMLFEFLSRLGLDYWRSKYSKIHPVTNIRHYHERIGGFVVLIFGELILSLLTDFSKQHSYKFFVYVFIFFLIAMNIFFLYFRLETSQFFVHALENDSKFWKVLWKFSHIPFYVALVAFAGCIETFLEIFEEDTVIQDLYTYNATLVGHNIEHTLNYSIVSNSTAASVTRGLQVTYCGSFAIIYFLLGIMALAHQEIVREDKKPLIRKTFRITHRGILAAAWVGACFIQDQHKEGWMYAGLVSSTFSIIFEELGRHSYSSKVRVVNKSTSALFPIKSRDSLKEQVVIEGVAPVTMIVKTSD